MYIVYLYQHLKDTEVYLHTYSYTYILGMNVQLYFSDVILKKKHSPICTYFLFPNSNSFQSEILICFDLLCANLDTNI